MFIIGIDAHTRRHSAAAIDQQGRVLDVIEIGAGPEDLARMVAWASGFDGERLIAIEGAKGFGLALTRRFLAAGESVVDIATHLTAQGRRSNRRRGKDDEGDAIAIARIALREPDLPRMSVAVRPIPRRTATGAQGRRRDVVELVGRRHNGNVFGATTGPELPQQLR